MLKALGPIWAAVPVKAFDQAKTRLSAALSGSEREGLARAMLTDVLCALGQSKAIERVIVITADSEVAHLARDLGAEVLHDQLCRGQTQAVEQAASAFAARGCAAMLTLPGDLPLLTPKDIDEVCALLCENTPLVMVPASGDGGTNAVLCCPPDSMRFHFVQRR
jgi:2-phospho-L-lactate guanylyltransferase